MDKFLYLVSAILAIGVLTACAAATSMGAGGPGTTRQTAQGEVFTDGKGMTLYTYDKDGAGKSNCNGLCAVFWPPVIAADTAKPTDGFTTISRDDGSKQWAYRGKPLYGYVSDTEPSANSGHGLDGVGRIAKR